MYDAVISIKGTLTKTAGSGTVTFVNNVPAFFFDSYDLIVIMAPTEKVVLSAELFKLKKSETIDVVVSKVLPDSASENSIFKNFVSDLSRSAELVENPRLINGETANCSESQCLFTPRKCQQLDRELIFLEKLCDQMTKSLQDQEGIIFLLKHQIANSSTSNSNQQTVTPSGYGKKISKPSSSTEQKSNAPKSDMNYLSANKTNATKKVNGTDRNPPSAVERPMNNNKILLTGSSKRTNHKIQGVTSDNDLEWLYVG
ncbi:hypothetical protein JTB14_009206 [Gonioctena quinquepunctata]|nr:hypothetical protein JTB14_009206 [Gonioctena quinquepunctata]